MRITIKELSDELMFETMMILSDDSKKNILRKVNKNYYKLKKYKKFVEEYELKYSEPEDEIIINLSPGEEQLKTIAIIENSLLAKNYKKNKKKEDYDK